MTTPQKWKKKFSSGSKAKKEAKDIRDSIYGYALVDGYKELFSSIFTAQPTLQRGFSTTLRWKHRF
jgi:hypothetical protein